ncbi:alanine racemase [Conyzicola lurida]|uniref:Alanine racemase n=1 Tax=Conyzicola lurida TaxID=1172621 RepID=A0A841AHG0_9MICO|nr:alanine racemase [Conyzicola lurida]MBB5843270.1 alanine racemase [Conyzicola lurida]
MTELPNGAAAVIDLAAFRRNVESLVATAAPSEVMLAVKANAYGHGMLPISLAALEAGATSLGVLEVGAGLELREAGITVPLFAWLHGTGTDFRAAAENRIDLGVSAVWQLEAIAESGASVPARVHLKIDTGLSRNGASAEDWPELVETALHLESQGFLEVYGAWSHLADASVADDEIALAKFVVAVEVATSLGARFSTLHLAASSAGIRMPEARFDFVRFGIAAFGISPFDDVDAQGLGLEAPMALTAPVLSLHGLPAGPFHLGDVAVDLDEPATLALVAVGYGDGVQSPAIGRAEVLLGGERRRIVALGVDRMLVDADDLEVAVGDRAVVFGSAERGEPTAEEWAAHADSIGDEIVASITPRVPRVYVG